MSYVQERLEPRGSVLPETMEPCVSTSRDWETNGNTGVVSIPVPGMDVTILTFWPLLLSVSLSLPFLL